MHLPSLIKLGCHHFLGGRADTLKEQAAGPNEAAVEMKAKFVILLDLSGMAGGSERPPEETSFLAAIATAVSSLNAAMAENEVLAKQAQAEEQERLKRLEMEQQADDQRAQAEKDVRAAKVHEFEQLQRTKESDVQ